MTFNLHDRRKFPAFFAASCIVILAVSFCFTDSERQTITFTLLTMAACVLAFLYSRHSQDLELFRELFREFNSRYDALNEKLNEIYGRPDGVPLKTDDFPVLFNYFNLCAEEYMYLTACCIDNRVWCSWRNGMLFFAKDPEIGALWRRELSDNNSYYGFGLD